MNSTCFKLSKNEKEILDTLWRESRPLSRSEIIELTENKSWKESSIHILLNQLLDKKAIQVDGFVKTGKNYGRTYTPTVTSNEYDMMQLKLNFDEINPENSTVANFVSFLVKSDKLTNDDLNELEDILQKRKK